MTIPEYLKEINLLFKSGSATEYSYRGYLTQLIQSLVIDVNVTNEPQRIAYGAPDYIITRKGIPIGNNILPMCHWWPGSSTSEAINPPRSG
jgi:hypothetical protein